MLVSLPLSKKMSRYLCLVINLLPDPIPQHNQYRCCHLHIPLLGVEEQHVPDNGVEEVSRQAILIQRVRNGNKRKRFYRRQGHGLCLVATDMRGICFVLQVVQSRGVVHNFVTQRKSLLRKDVLLLLSCKETQIHETEERKGKRTDREAGKDQKYSGLTVGVLVIHHVQIIFISFHISKEIICRDVTTLSLLIL